MAAVLIAALASCAAAAVTALRIGSPMDNDWVESAVVDQCRRAMRGAALYTSPSVEFVPDNYPPLYLWLCGGLMRMFGPSAVVCRGVSLVCTAAVAGLLWAAGAGLDDRRLRLMGPLLFLAYFVHSGQCYDLARVDMPALALALASVLLLLRSVSRGSGRLPSSPNSDATACRLTMRNAYFPWIAGLLMALAILTKHNYVLAGAAVALGLLALDARRFFRFALPAAAVPSAVFMWLNTESRGWSTFYLFTQPAAHPYEWTSHLPQFLLSDVGMHGCLLAAGIAWLIASGRSSVRFPAGTAFVAFDSRRPGFNQRRIIIVALAAAGALAATAAGRFKVGGYTNNLVPAWTFTLLLGIVLLNELIQNAAESRTPSFRAVDVRRRRGVWFCLTAISATLAMEYAGLPWGRCLNHADRTAAASNLADWINRQTPEGPVWAFSHSGLNRSAAAFAHACPAGFLVDTDDMPARAAFLADLSRRVQDRAFAALLLDERNDRKILERIRPLLEDNYTPLDVPVEWVAACETLTGHLTGPKKLYVHK